MSRRFAPCPGQGINDQVSNWSAEEDVAGEMPTVDGRLDLPLHGGTTGLGEGDRVLFAGRKYPAAGLGTATGGVVPSKTVTPAESLMVTSAAVS